MTTFALVAGYVWCALVLLCLILVVAALVWQWWQDCRHPDADVVPLHPQSSHVRVVSGRDGAA